MGTVAREWSDYSIQIAPFRTIFCTISYHFLHHNVPFFCTRFKHCVPPHHTVHRDFTLKHCAHQCNVQEAVHGNGKYSHVGFIIFSSSMFNLEARRWNSANVYFAQQKPCHSANCCSKWDFRWQDICPSVGRHHHHTRRSSPPAPIYLLSYIHNSSHIFRSSKSKV